MYSFDDDAEIGAVTNCVNRSPFNTSQVAQKQLTVRTHVAQSVMALCVVLLAPAAQAGITFVSASPLADYGSVVSAVTVNQPAGTQPGDTLLAQIVVYDASGLNVPSAPSGWNLIRYDSKSGGNHLTSWLYFHVAGASEPAWYSWRIASQYAAGVIGDWRGASAFPIDGSSGAGGNSNVAAPSLTPVNNGELQVYFYGAQSGSAPSISMNSAMFQCLNDRSSQEGFTLVAGDAAAPPAKTPSATYLEASSNDAVTAQAVLLIPNSAATPTPTATPAIPSVSPTPISQPSGQPTLAPPIPTPTLEIPSVFPTPIPGPSGRPTLAISLIDETSTSDNDNFGMWGKFYYALTQQALQNQMEAVNQWYDTDQQIVVYGFGQTAPAGAWPISVVDGCSCPGGWCGGSHWFDPNTRLPTACIGQEYTTSGPAYDYWETVKGMAHEASEMICDPDGGGVECVDPVGGSQYGTFCPEEGVTYLWFHACANLYPFEDFLVPAAQAATYGYTDYMKFNPVP